MTTNIVTVENVLDLPVPETINPGDDRVVTLRQLFALMAVMVWNMDEEFDGKRPFGNSGWYNDIIDMVQEQGEFDEDVDVRGLIRTALELEVLK